jgi:predicted aspartyl protease
MAGRIVSEGSFFMLVRALFLLVLTLLAGCDPPPAINCNLTMIAQMPLEVQDHLLVIPAGINGKLVHLVVDSGAERTTISNAVADRLGLPHDSRYVNHYQGIGGGSTTTDVTVDRLVLGGVHFPVSRIAVGAFKLQTEHGLSADGLLGADILLAFDMDIDVPEGKLTLYLSRMCPDTKPPWTEQALEIAGVRARKDRLLLPIELDDVSGMAILDTGAQANVIGIEMARRMGLNDQTMAGDRPVRQRGVGPGEIISHLHQFRLLRIGPVAEQDPRITVLPADFGVGDALIGEEFLQGRRVWLSFRNRQVFVSHRPDER